jgi:hypothetical protein
MAVKLRIKNHQTFIGRTTFVEETLLISILISSWSKSTVGDKVSSLDAIFDESPMEQTQNNRKRSLYRLC